MSSSNTDVVQHPQTPQTEPTRVAAAHHDHDTTIEEGGVSKGLFTHQEDEDGEDLLSTASHFPSSPLGMKRSRSNAMGMVGSDDGAGDKPPPLSNTAASVKKPPPPPTRLVQTHLDFGQSLAPKHCCHCGMRFDVCDEDQAVHRRVCAALRRPAQPALSTGPILLPLNPLIADIKAARAAGVASKTQIRNPNAPATAATTSAPRRSTAKGKASGSGCDMDLLAALKPGSTGQSDLHTSNGIEAIATATTIVEGRTCYLIDTGVHYDWTNLASKREHHNNNADIITTYMRNQWGGCICSGFSYRVLLLLRIPTSDEITATVKKQHGATTSLVEVVGSINYRANEDRLHDPLLFSNMVPTVRTLAYIDTTDNPQLHPFAYHPQDSTDVFPPTPSDNFNDNCDGGDNDGKQSNKRSGMPSSLQQPLCWRDEGYVRGRKLREVGDLIPLTIHTPTTLVDIGGIHLVASAFEPKKAKKSVMDFFSKPASPATAAAAPPATPKALLPLLDTALSACMAVCGVGAAHRAADTCAFVDRQCSSVGPYTPRGGDADLRLISSLMKLWEEAEESLVARDQRLKIRNLASEAHLCGALTDSFIDQVVARRLKELPVITRYSRWEDCPTTAHRAYPEPLE